MNSTTTDISACFSQDLSNPEAFKALIEAAFDSASAFQKFRAILAEAEQGASSGQGDAKAMALKLGMCYLAMGEPETALTWLDKAPQSALRHVQIGSAYRDQGKLKEAIAEYEKAAAAGADKVEADALIAECHLQGDQIDAAAKLVDRHASAGTNSASWNYAKGRVLQSQGNHSAAIEHLEKALSIDSQHPQATFHLAYLLDLYGDDERALELYHAASELPFVFAHALINLAVIHEDNGHFEKAAACLRRVLAVQPNHARARLYMKDVMAAGDMYIDEQQSRTAEKRSAVLDIPVTDFELSVRSRNCLKKMNINTLGDLLRISEIELLAYKNFGETSLKEIKAMLAQKGLSLGQNAIPGKSILPASDLVFEPEEPLPVSAEQTEASGRPVSTMELSVRSRKCLQRLGINTIGELLSRSEEELLESRNFGQTSLQEIKTRLSEMGLSLRMGPSSSLPPLPPAAPMA